MGTKRKWKAKYTWLTIFLAIIIAVGIVFFRTTWVENYLAHKLIERTAAESDGFYQLSYDKLSIRSEDHTSELQSHFSISYVVFCLKKKKNNITVFVHRF